jgi:hypothetical protein
MAEKSTIGKVHLSSSFTGFIKYFPIIIGLIGISIQIVTGHSEQAIIPLAFVLIGISINFFIVDASVDVNYIYIKQWIKVKKYPIDSLDKVGDFKKGYTLIDIKTDSLTTKTFLIINDFDNSFLAHEYKDISTFLIKLKTLYCESKSKTIG